MHQYYKGNYLEIFSRGDSSKPTNLVFYVYFFIYLTFLPSHLSTYLSSYPSTCESTYCLTLPHNASLPCSRSAFPSSILTLWLDAEAAALPHQAALSGPGAGVVVLTLVHARHAFDAEALGGLADAGLVCEERDADKRKRVVEMLGGNEGGM